MKGDGTGWFMGGVVEELGEFREPPLTSRKAGDKDLPGCRHKLAHHSPHTKLAPAEGYTVFKPLKAIGPLCNDGECYRCACCDDGIGCGIGEGEIWSVFYWIRKEWRAIA